MNPVAAPDQAFSRGIEIGGAKNVFTCLDIQGFLRQSLSITQKWLYVL